MNQGKYLAVVLLLLATTVNGATLVFATNPLIGDPALVTDGRQIVNGAGGGPVFSLDPAADVITFDRLAFDVDSVQFVNGNTTDPGFPTSGTTVAVVRNAFAAGAAADALAAVIETAGPGFFMYFNNGLNVPRLVYSTDLSDANADLAILARFNNLSGQTDVLSNVSASNFAPIPEPSTLLLTCAGFAGAWFVSRRRSRRS